LRGGGLDILGKFLAGLEDCNHCVVAHVVIVMKEDSFLSDLLGIILDMNNGVHLSFRSDGIIM
jgi:hypothetical protein